MPPPPLFTAILDTYNRPALLKEAVEALRRQTYDKLELILISNAATPESITYLRDTAATDKRVKLVYFQENQYSLDDPLMMLDTCLNEGLRQASGDLVWYQADDDLIADDYAEKMVALFAGDPDCLTAAGLPVAIDFSGKVIGGRPRTSNHRPRYMPGHELALEVLRGGRTMFSAPGTIFTIRRDALLKAGGYHRAIEHSQLYGIVPFGVTAFDETARFYWRRHEGQLNKSLVSRGRLGTSEKLSLLRDWRIEERWMVFGPAIAREVATTLKADIWRIASHWFANNLVALRPTAAMRIFRSAWNHFNFWRGTAVRFGQMLRQKFVNLRNRLSA